MAAPSEKETPVVSLNRLTFVSDCDIVNHINLTDAVAKTTEKKTRKLRSQVQKLAKPSYPQRSTRKKVSYKEDGENKFPSNSESSDSDEETDVNKLKHKNTPSVLVEGYEEDSKRGVVSSAVYQFKTPKRAGQMAKLAAETCTPITSKTTPLKPVSTKKSTKQQPQTPATRKLPTRRSARRGAVRDVDLDSDYSSESEDVSDDEEDMSDSASSTSSRDSESVKASANKPQQSKNNTTTMKRRTRADIQTENMAEDYFVAHSDRTVTSDRTLARLKNPKMSQQQLKNMLHSTPSSHSEDTELLYREHRGLFNRWMYQLLDGFNLLLYGLGSKRVLLDQFRNMMLQDCSHIVVNGFFPSITLKNILNSITEDILSHTGSFKSPIDQINFVQETLKESGEDVFLLVNNIDGQMLRGRKVQSALSSLAQIPQFHLVASIDHINAPLIWDQTKASCFNWLWYDVTNFEPYTEETSYENSLLVQHSGALALSSLKNVLRSLTPNARGIFDIIVNYQLENKDSSLYNGLSFQDLYQKCREAFLVNSDLTLRAQLTEFRDHKLLKSRKGIDGIEFLSVPIENSTLVEFIDQQQQE
ncbi:origin recognition complex subunit 2-like [Antedon mediterranea]|uniref:origin recognition complex subunit 2-like n=1 Tax=Antedon mediterranea TaxID=105859 RepID=UPI003AF4CB77